MTRRLALSALSSILLVSTPALAQSPNARAAEGLFQQGVSLLQAGQTREACEKFVASYGLDPANGTLQNVASCHEKEGKTTSAWSEWLELAGKAAQANQKDREQLARTRASELAKDLSRLELRFPSNSNVATIEIDGQAVARSGWTAPLPVDPGQHTIVFKGTGKQDATSTITIARAKNETLEVPLLKEDPNAPVEPSTHAPPAKASVDTSEAATGNSRRTLGYVVGGIGIVGVGVGAFFGVRAISQKNDANCDGTSCPTRAAVDQRDEAKTSATISTIGFAAGVVALGIGAYLVLSSTTPPKPTATLPRMRPRIDPFRSVGGGGAVLALPW